MVEDQLHERHDEADEEHGDKRRMSDHRCAVPLLGHS
jgi:hypothetical protein